MAAERDSGPHSNGGRWRTEEAAARGEEGYSEVTLADIVRTLQRRKFVLIAVFLAAVLAGVGITAATTPQYESSATIIPLEHRDIITNWLKSRQAAEHVVTARGDPLMQELYPERWDAGSERWDPGEPSLEGAGKRLQGSVSVTTSTVQGDRLVEITVRLPSASMARDVAHLYVDSLDVLRPHLENITRQEAFVTYWRDGGNEQEARQLAEVEARNKEYWIPLDAADLPGGAVVPNTTLNMALAVVLGLMLGVFSVFIAEWVSSYRAQGARKVAVPSPPQAEREAEHEKGPEAAPAWAPRREAGPRGPARRYR